jgi:hypothetical protein
MNGHKYVALIFIYRRRKGGETISDMYAYVGMNFLFFKTLLIFTVEVITFSSHSV